MTAHFLLYVKIILLFCIPIETLDREMEVVKTIGDLDQKLLPARKAGKKIGLVPTMGALHDGHASLIRRSVEMNDITVVSDFVNPTQFNDKNDLLRYPRTLEADCELAGSLGADYLFCPSVSEMYPEPDTRRFSYPPVDTVMEGPRRPGHFNGVCQIVSKLFNLVKPDRAYFGEKDYQQIAVIKVMTADLSFPIEICPCPIVREADGLALSSRNSLLSSDERKLAVNISQTLFSSCTYAKDHSVEETRRYVIETLNAMDGLEVEYYEIVDGETLQSVSSWDGAPSVVGCITVYCGKLPVRLIDNVRYK